MQMQSVITLIFLSLLTAGILSCNKADEDNNNNNANAQVTATINGVYWESEGTSATLQKYYSNIAPIASNFTLFAYAKDYSQVLFFAVTDYENNGEDECLRVNTFMPVTSTTDTTMFMDSVFYNYTLYNYINGSNEYTTMGNGQLTITSCNLADSTINGTFEFVSTTTNGDTAFITDGKLINLKVEIQ